MKTFKTRHQFYLPDALSEQLEQLAAKPGASKTSIMSDALTAWIERRGQNELDSRFGPRLDRLGKAGERQAQDVKFLIEMLGTFVLHQLTLTAHHPAFDDAARALGKRRYEAFVELVGRRIAGKGSVSVASSPDQPEGTT